MTTLEAEKEHQAHQLDAAGRLLAACWRGLAGEERGEVRLMRGGKTQQMFTSGPTPVLAGLSRGMWVAFDAYFGVAPWLPTVYPAKPVSTNPIRPQWSTVGRLFLARSCLGVVQVLGNSIADNLAYQIQRQGLIDWELYRAF